MYVCVVCMYIHMYICMYVCMNECVDSCMYITTNGYASSCSLVKAV